MQGNPADFKVVLFVSATDLCLNETELAVLQEMVGPRFNKNRGIIKLTSDRFPNRVENKRYLTFLLENILLECKRLAICAESEK
jgi:small subunit ribosomal protein S35